MLRALRWAAAVASVAALALGMGATGAYFTAKTQVADNTIRAGRVAVSAEPTSAALSIDSIAPGASVVRTMSVLNDGNLPIDYVVTGAKRAGITEFYESLTCTVTVDNREVFAGPISALRTTPVAVAPGARSQMQFAVGLPGSAGNTLAGDYVRMTLYVDAEQVH